MSWLNRFRLELQAVWNPSEALPLLRGPLLYRFFDRPLDPPIVQTARGDDGRAKPDEPAAGRCCSSAADDDGGGLREPKEEEVPRQILGGTPASVAPIEFEPGLDRLVDPFDKMHEEFAPLFEAASLSPRQEPILELCHPKIRTLRQEVFDL